MISQRLFHIHHVIPPPKFITTFMIVPRHLITHVRVELGTVFCEIFIFCFGISNAGIKVDYILPDSNGFQRVIKHFTKPLMGGVLPNIDGGFRSPVVCASTLERVKIRVPHNLIIFNGNDVRIF